MDGVRWVICSRYDIGSVAGRQFKALRLAVGTPVENPGEIRRKILFPPQDLFYQ
jgi:hypothetical protein